ncbi:MAG: Gp37 family protein [Brasilonema angustatum HA4187-MV1]|jgi:hypothetical protein|nr:Gp37 family protein [Brasilonema angustatum HA4187-MV1]
MSAGLGLTELELDIMTNPLRNFREGIFPILVGTLPQDAGQYGTSENEGDIVLLFPTSDAARPETEQGQQLVGIDIIVLISLRKRYDDAALSPDTNGSKAAIEQALDEVIRLLKGYKPSCCPCARPIFFVGHRLFPPDNGLWRVEVSFRLERYI